MNPSSTSANAASIAESRKKCNSPKWKTRRARQVLPRRKLSGMPGYQVNEE